MSVVSFVEGEGENFVTRIVSLVENPDGKFNLGIMTTTRKEPLHADVNMTSEQAHILLAGLADAGLRTQMENLVAQLAERTREVALLREAAEPFAMRALSRRGQDTSVPDNETLEVTLGMCRTIQRVMAAT